MTEKNFIKICKDLIKKYTEENSTNEILNDDDIYVVWCCKILKNFKVLGGSIVPDGRYFEITYDGDKNKIYFDAYRKEVNKCIDLEVK